MAGKEMESKGFVERVKNVAILGGIIAGLIWIVKTLAR